MSFSPSLATQVRMVQNTVNILKVKLEEGAFPYTSQ